MSNSSAGVFLTQDSSRQYVHLNPGGLPRLLHRKKNQELWPTRRFQCFIRGPTDHKGSGAAALLAVKAVMELKASEWKRKCELAGIFLNTEKSIVNIVHSAVLATLQSASAPY